jgi:hypothetical protein
MDILSPTEEIRQREWLTIKAFFLANCGTILGEEPNLDPNNIWALFDNVTHSGELAAMIHLHGISTGDKGSHLYKGILTTLPTKIKLLVHKKYNSYAQKQELEKVQFVIVVTLNKLLRLFGASEQQRIPANPETFISGYIKNMMTRDVALHSSTGLEKRLHSMCNNLCYIPAKDEALMEDILQNTTFKSNSDSVTKELQTMLCGEAMYILAPVVITQCHVYAHKHLPRLSPADLAAGKLALVKTVPVFISQSCQKLTQVINQYLVSLPDDLHLRRTFDLGGLAAAMAIKKFKDANRDPLRELRPEHSAALEVFQQIHKQYADTIQQEYLQKGKLEGLDFISIFADNLVQVGVSQPSSNVCSSAKRRRTYSKMAKEHSTVLHPEWYIFMTAELRKDYNINFKFQGVGTCMENAFI